MNRQMENNTWAGVPRRASRKGWSWQMMFVGEHGRIIRVNHTGRWLAVAALGVAFLLLAAVVFAALYINGRSKHVTLRDALEKARGTISSLQQENDALLARLAVLNTTGQALEEAAGKGKKDAIAAIENLAEETATAAAAVPPAAGAVIRIENFRLLRRDGSDMADVDFVVRKVNASQPSVSGRVFVVLKGKSGQEDRYQVIPEAVLANGRPVPPARGQSFFVERFRTIRMSARVDRPEEFHLAIVLAFNPDGRLLQEEAFQVKVLEAEKTVN